MLQLMKQTLKKDQVVFDNICSIIYRMIGDCYFLHTLSWIELI